MRPTRCPATALAFDIVVSAYASQHGQLAHMPVNMASTGFVMDLVTTYDQVALHLSTTEHVVGRALSCPQEAAAFTI